MIDPKSITARDLRIGNTYWSVKWQQEVTCTLEDFYDLCAKSDGATAHPPVNEMFEGIKITPERLLSAGFEKRGTQDEYIWHDENWNTTLRYHDGYLEVSEWVGVDIEFWHELQNILWDLARKEI